MQAIVDDFVHERLQFWDTAVSHGLFASHNIFTLRYGNSDAYTLRDLRTTLKTKFLTLTAQLFTSMVIYG